MAKRRARIEARVSKLKRKQPKASAGGDDTAAPAAPQPQTHIRKMQKRVRFLEKVKTSALAARAAVFKRKRKAQGIISLDSLVRRACAATVYALTRLVAGGCASRVAEPGPGG